MKNHEQRNVSVSRQDWSFDRRIERDENRHNEKVKEAIRDNLDSVVSDGTIITADPRTKKTIKVPMRSIELPHIRYGEPKEGIGTGAGQGKPKPGDKVGTDPGAGDGPGEEFYEAELSIAEIQDMVFADLGLPNLRPKGEPNIHDTEVVFNDVRKRRSPTNIDLGRTVLQNLLRNAQETGEAKIQRISPEDFRVRTWEEENRPKDSAVVVAMADISGSMGEFEKYVTRAFCWWSVSFLRSKYPSVEVVFIAHDTEAYEVTEEQFFTRGSSGGTKCSSANRMALELINNRYQTDRYNVYPLHFSDGDNWSTDNPDCVNLVKELLDTDISQYAYIQIGKAARSQLLEAYTDEIKDDRFKGLIIQQREDVLKALKQVFSVHQENTR
jgi:sporulation protein YhbH